MTIIWIIVGCMVLFVGMGISDLFTETVDKAFKKAKESSVDESH